jgi:hypothetical protein
LNELANSVANRRTLIGKRVKRIILRLLKLIIKLMSDQDLLYGRRAWNFLHSMAAYYPETPTDAEQQAATTFIRSFMDVGIEHPEWGARFMDNYKTLGPPDVSSTEGLSVWMCKQHNMFNQELGKPLASCQYEDLKKRWGAPAKQ